MELTFNRTSLPYLRQLVREVQNQEVTQEVKLTDAMPDIGRILGAWGQVLVRSKEWNGTHINVSGGVVVFVLYTPEDGSEPKSVESWLPFQMKWSLPESERDGTIILSGYLRGVDARSTSARKMMVRANVGILAEALEPSQADFFVPAEVPEDIQLLRKSYPICYPKEAGEKVFLLEEELKIPSGLAVDKIIRYELRPELIDKKVMAGKVVFRGVAIVHVLYRTEDAGIESVDFEVPFSQYTDLEQQYEQDADAYVTMAVTSLELEQQDEDGLQMKAGLVGQYVIYDRPVIELIEDAYSPNREVAPQIQELSLPVVLDMRKETVHAQMNLEVNPTAQVVDSAFYAEYPRVRWNGDAVQLELLGTCHMLYATENGVNQSASGRWEGQWNMQTDAENKVTANVCVTGKPVGSIMGDNASVRSDVLLEVMTIGNQGLPMVSALNIGEESEADPNRPSVILRRAGAESLWELAKRCGATVEEIRKVNKLTADPEEGQFLLIPVS